MFFARDKENAKRCFVPNTGNVPSPNAPLKRVLAYTGCFSRMGTIKDIHDYLSQRLRIKEEDMRLWLYNSEVGTRALRGTVFLIPLPLNF